MQLSIPKQKMSLIPYIDMTTSTKSDQRTVRTIGTPAYFIYIQIMIESFDAMIPKSPNN